MKLVWSDTNNEALPDFKDFNKLYDELPKSKYVTLNDYKRLRKLHDEAGLNIVNYCKKLNEYIKYLESLNKYYMDYINDYANLPENKTKNANKDFKIMNGKRKKIFNEKDIEEIKRLKKEGISNRRIAKIMKCSETTIRNYLKQTT